jgi:hypothetical protein
MVYTCCRCGDMIGDWEVYFQFETNEPMCLECFNHWYDETLAV